MAIMSHLATNNRFTMNHFMCHVAIKSKSLTHSYVMNITTPDRLKHNFHYNYYEKKNGKGRWRKLLNVDDHNGHHIGVAYEGARVSQLIAPIGPGQTLMPMAKFTYGPTHTMSMMLSEIVRPITTTKNVLLRLFRTLNNQPYSKTNFFWVAQEPHQGYL